MREREGMERERGRGRMETRGRGRGREWQREGKGTGTKRGKGNGDKERKRATQTQDSVKQEREKGVRTGSRDGASSPNIIPRTLRRVGVGGDGHTTTAASLAHWCWPRRLARQLIIVWPLVWGHPHPHPACMAAAECAYIHTPLARLCVPQRRAGSQCAESALPLVVGEQPGGGRE